MGINAFNQPLAKVANEQIRSVTKADGPYNFIRACRQIYSSGPDILPISDLPEMNPNNAKLNKLYLSEDGSYVARTPKGEVQQASLADKKSIRFKNFNDPTFRKRVLKETAALGHTNPTRGIVAFWDATVISMARELKSAYKIPIQVFSRDFATKLISNRIRYANFFRAILAAAIIAPLDVGIISPLERYKTWLLSQSQKVTFKGYLKQIKEQQGKHLSPEAKLLGVFQELYRGTLVTMGKQFLMNLSLLGALPLANQVMEPYKKDHPKSAMVGASALAGIASAFVGAPLDALKTLTQQQTGKNEKLKVLLDRVLASPAGWRGLFAGLPAKFVLIAMGYGLNGLFLNIFSSLRDPHKPEASPSKSNTIINPMDELTRKLSQLSIDSIQDEEIKAQKIEEFLQALGPEILVQLQEMIQLSPEELEKRFGKDLEHNLDEFIHYLEMHQSNTHDGEDNMEISPMIKPVIFTQTPKDSNIEKMEVEEPENTFNKVNRLGRK